MIAPTPAEAPSGPAGVVTLTGGAPPWRLLRALDAVRGCAPPDCSPLAWLAPYGLAVVAAALALFVVRAHYYSPWNIDDPWISYRYATNFAEGQGMLFNRGEPVEAYSNFLWTVLAAMLIKARLSPESFMPWIGVACGAWAVFFLATRQTAARAGAWRGRLAALALATSAPLVYWAPSGLETPFFAVLLLMGVWRAGEAMHEPDPALAARRWNESWAWLTAMSLARIEGPMFCAVVALFGWSARRRASAGVHRAFLVGGVTSLGAQLLYHGWRLAFFGALLPNSFTAKATGSPLVQWLAGLRYTAGGFAFDAPLITALLLGGGVVWLLARKAQPRASDDEMAGDVAPRLCPHTPLFAAALGAQVFFSVYVGGDWMYFSRFLVPGLPLAAVLAQDAFQRLWAWLAPRDASHARRDALAVGCAGLVLLGWAAEWRQAGPMMRVLRENRLVPPMIELAYWMRAAVPESAVLAAEEAGYIPYYARLGFIDMLGLVTPAVAQMPGEIHRKTNTPWILERRPDYILLLAVPHDDEYHNPIGKMYPASRSMVESEDFQRSYRLVMMMPRGTHVFGRANMLLYGRVQPGESTANDLPYPRNPEPVR
jgi:hypothetical protein